MNAEETAAKLGDILSKRKAIGKLRQSLEASNPSHWLVTEMNQSKVTAWLKSGEASRIIERLEDGERVALIALASEAEAPAIPPRPVATTPGPVTQAREPEPAAIPSDSAPVATQVDEAPREKPAPSLPPLIAKWKETRATLPEEIIFFARLGDFLECYLSDAELAASMIGAGEHVGKTRGGVSVVSLPFKAAEPAIMDLWGQGRTVYVQDLVGEITIMEPPANSGEADEDEEIPADIEGDGEPEQPEPVEFITDLTAQVSERMERKTEAIPLSLAPVAQPAPAAQPAAGSLEALIAQAVAPLLAAHAPAAPAPQAPPLDLNAVRAVVMEELAKVPASSGPIVTLKRGGLPDVVIEGRQHFRFSLLLASLEAKAPALVVGPAGTGKTSAGVNAARGLGLPFFPMSFSPMTTKADLVGFVDAGGNYRQTGFVDSFKNGGLFIADEFDAARPDVAVILNGAVANGFLMLPTGEILEASPDWRFMACANTHGTGPDAIYCGRNRLDGATLDRFFTVEFPHDDGLEAHAVGISAESPECTLGLGGIPTASEWLATVQAARVNLEQIGAHAVISQRATILGVQLASVGVGRDWLIAGLLAKGLKGSALDAVNRLR